MNGDVASAEIEAALADVLARVELAFAHRHVLVGLVAILLDHDGVGAGRHLCAGEDARRFARADRTGWRLAGGDALHDPELCRQGPDIGGAHGIAVHCGHVGGRLGQPRLERLGQHAAEPLVKRNHFRA
jgi:hypothetical protein